MKLFQKVKEIRSKQDVLYFERYAIFQTKYLSLYIHTIHRSDDDWHLHSHPWNFLTMVLKGSYVERKPGGFLRLKNPGAISWLSREGFHKIDKIEEGPVKTLFLALGKWQPWYYLVDDKLVESKEYRKLKNANMLFETRWYS